VAADSVSAGEATGAATECSRFEPRPPPRMSSSTFKLLLLLWLAVAVVGTIVAWVVPVVVVENWAASRAGDDDYVVYAAIGQAESLMWLSRVVCPVMIVIALTALRRVELLRRVIGDAASEFRAATEIASTVRGAGGLKSGLLRLLLAAWLLLAGAHLVGSIDARTWEWAYYRTRGGDEVLPNVSLENRDVIRYLWARIPPGSRVLAASDQKLFFLSYYLLPSRLYHVMHADAEFVIPLAHQQRSLAAYPLSEVPPEAIARIGPDVTLEYFQDQGRVDRSRLTEDREWVAFWRAEHETKEVPPYLVVLKPAPAGDRP
jgi:hypothetical protein